MTVTGVQTLPTGSEPTRSGLGSPFSELLPAPGFDGVDQRSTVDGVDQRSNITTATTERILTTPFERTAATKAVAADGVDEPTARQPGPAAQPAWSSPSSCLTFPASDGASSDLARSPVARTSRARAASKRR
jgi:hypothetical protein